jgi:ankyrin repeat protein
MSRQTFDKKIPVYYYKGQEPDKNLEKNLTEAVKSGEIDRIKGVLLSGVSVNLQGEDRRTVYHTLLNIPDEELSEDRKLQICDALYEHAAMIDQPDAYGVTPLYIAIQRQYSKIVRWLMLRGVNNNAKDAQGRNPLHYAVSPLINKCVVEEKVSDLVILGDTNQQAATRIIDPLRNIYEDIIKLLSVEPKTNPALKALLSEVLTDDEIKLLPTDKTFDQWKKLLDPNLTQNEIKNPDTITGTNKMKQEQRDLLKTFSPSVKDVLAKMTPEQRMVYPIIKNTQEILTKFIKKMDNIDDIYSGSDEEKKIQQQLNDELLQEFANKQGNFDEGRIITILGRICDEAYRELMVKTGNVLELMKIEPGIKKNDILQTSSKKLSEDIERDTNKKLTDVKSLDNKNPMNEIQLTILDKYQGEIHRALGKIIDTYSSKTIDHMIFVFLIINTFRANYFYFYGKNIISKIKFTYDSTSYSFDENSEPFKSKLISSIVSDPSKPSDSNDFIFSPINTFLNSPPSLANPSNEEKLRTLVDGQFINDLINTFNKPCGTHALFTRNLREFDETIRPIYFENEKLGNFTFLNYTLDYVFGRGYYNNLEIKQVGPKLISGKDLQVPVLEDNDIIKFSLAKILLDKNKNLSGRFAALVADFFVNHFHHIKYSTNTLTSSPSYHQFRGIENTFSYAYYYDYLKISPRMFALNVLDDNSYNFRQNIFSSGRINEHILAMPGIKPSAGKGGDLKNIYYYREMQSDAISKKIFDSIYFVKNINGVARKIHDKFKNDIENIKPETFELNKDRLIREFQFGKPSLKSGKQPMVICLPNIPPLHHVPFNRYFDENILINSNICSQSVCETDLNNYRINKIAMSDDEYIRKVIENIINNLEFKNDDPNDIKTVNTFVSFLFFSFINPLMKKYYDSKATVHDSIEKKIINDLFSIMHDAICNNLPFVNFVSFYDDIHMPRKSSTSVNKFGKTTLSVGTTYNTIKNMYLNELDNFEKSKAIADTSINLVTPTKLLVNDIRATIDQSLKVTSDAIKIHIFAPSPGTKPQTKQFIDIKNMLSHSESKDKYCLISCILQLTRYSQDGYIEAKKFVDLLPYNNISKKIGDSFMDDIYGEYIVMIRNIFSAEGEIKGQNLVTFDEISFFADTKKEPYIDIYKTLKKINDILVPYHDIEKMIRSRFASDIEALYLHSDAQPSKDKKQKTELINFLHRMTMINGKYFELTSNKFDDIVGTNDPYFKSYNFFLYFLNKMSYHINELTEKVKKTVIIHPAMNTFLEAKAIYFVPTYFIPSMLTLCFDSIFIIRDKINKTESNFSVEYRYIETDFIQTDYQTNIINNTLKTELVNNFRTFSIDSFNKIRSFTKFLNKFIDYINEFTAYKYIDYDIFGRMQNMQGIFSNLIITLNDLETNIDKITSDYVKKYFEDYRGKGNYYDMSTSSSTGTELKKAIDDSKKRINFDSKVKADLEIGPSPDIFQFIEQSIFSHDTDRKMKRPDQKLDYQDPNYLYYLYKNLLLGTGASTISVNNSRQILDYVQRYPSDSYDYRINYCIEYIEKAMQSGKPAPGVYNIREHLKDYIEITKIQIIENLLGLNTDADYGKEYPNVFAGLKSYTDVTEMVTESGLNKDNKEDYVKAAIAKVIDSTLNKLFIDYINAGIKKWIYTRLFKQISATGTNSLSNYIYSFISDAGIIISIPDYFTVNMSKINDDLNKMMENWKETFPIIPDTVFNLKKYKKKITSGTKLYKYIFQRSYHSGDILNMKKCFSIDMDIINYLLNGCGANTTSNTTLRIFTPTRSLEKDKDGNTPLHLAIDLQHVEVIDLLSRNQNIHSMRNLNGQTHYDKSISVLKSHLSYVLETIPEFDSVLTSANLPNAIPSDLTISQNIAKSFINALIDSLGDKALGNNIPNNIKLLPLVTWYIFNHYHYLNLSVYRGNWTPNDHRLLLALLKKHRCSACDPETVYPYPIEIFDLNIQEVTKIINCDRKEYKEIQLLKNHTESLAQLKEQNEQLRKRIEYLASSPGAKIHSALIIQLETQIQENQKTIDKYEMMPALTTLKEEDMDDFKTKVESFKNANNSTQKLEEFYMNGVQEIVTNDNCSKRAHQSIWKKYIKKNHSDIPRNIFIRLILTLSTTINNDPINPTLAIEDLSEFTIIEKALGEVCKNIKSVYSLGSDENYLLDEKKNLIKYIMKYFVIPDAYAVLFYYLNKILLDKGLASKSIIESLINKPLILNPNASDTRFDIKITKNMTIEKYMEGPFLDAVIDKYSSDDLTIEINSLFDPIRKVLLSNSNIQINENGPIMRGINEKIIPYISVLLKISYECISTSFAGYERYITIMYQMLTVINVLKKNANQYNQINRKEIVDQWNKENPHIDLSQVNYTLMDSVFDPSNVVSIKNLMHVISSK